MMGDDSLLVVGDALMDVIVPFERFNEGSVHHATIDMVAGGLGNTAVWCSRLGVKTFFAGVVSDDTFGKAYEDDLHSEGVTSSLIKTKGKTGVCLSLVHGGGQRSMIVDRGVNDDIDAWKVADDAFDNAVWIYFSGYSLINEGLQERFLKMAEKAKGSGKKLVFNGGDHNIITKNREAFLRMMEHVNVLVLNEEEAKALTETNEIDDTCTILDELVGTYIVTLGPKGSIGSEGKEQIESKACDVEKVMDTTGAGDAFTAGLIAGLMQGKDIRGACELGHETASKVITRMGAR
ncbi:carbohydrate kinase family protein [Candidatus Altiarchaeota archaeon]